MTIDNILINNNASQLLNRNYVIFYKALGVHYNKQQIDNATHYLVQQIRDQFQNQPQGRVIYCYSNELFWIIATLRASWQLGCVIFAADYNPDYNKIPEFQNFHNFIDVVIGHDRPNKNHCLNVLENKPHILYEKCDINRTIEFDQPGFDEFDSNLPAVITHTSGTTGYPKIVYFSHRDIINLAKSQALMSRMEENEISGHVKTLHHGSLFLNYALPLLSMCDRHYCFHDLPMNSSPTTWVKQMLELVVEHQLTRIMIPYNWIRFASELDGPDLKQKVYIHSILGATTQEMQVIVDKINPKSIVNMWGCSEIGSCFHSMTDRSNLEQYNPNRFDIINPDIDYLVEENCIKLKWKFSKQWQTIGDKFEIQDNVLWWRGRVNFITRNGIKVNVENIKTFLEKTFNTINFSIVIDYEFNQLYLAVYDTALPSNLDQINSMLKKEFDCVHIFDKIKVLNYNQILMGMKPSQPILLYMFRNEKQTS